ncbi:MAG: hypothetical protein WCH31_02820 [Actinomycetes bacterium]
MNLLIQWLAFPALLCVLSLGAGLLIEALSGKHLPGPLLLPIGFAGIITEANLMTLKGTTARLIVPLVLGTVVLGYAVGRHRRFTLDRWLSAAMVVAFLVLAAPVLLSGGSTFAGYATLDDTANWFTLIDHVFAHGRSTSMFHFGQGLDANGLPRSAYEYVVSAYMNSGYPVGALMPLGVGKTVIGQDVAWVYQPYLAFQAALLVSCLWMLLLGLTRSPRLRAASVVVAAQPALLVGYSLIGSVKEVVTAPLLVMLAVLVERIRRSTPSYRDLVPVMVVAASVISVLTVGSAIWLLPAAAPLLLLARTMSLRAFAQRTAYLIGVLAVLAIPALLTMNAFFRSASGVLTTPTKSSDALGSTLFHPLSDLQIFGVWPVGDFRNRPATMWPTALLITIILVASTIGIVRSSRKQLFALPAYILICVGGIILNKVFGGSAWTSAKALATASPGFLAAAAVGLQTFFDRRAWERLAVAGAVLITGGVLWSNGLAYSSVRLAPHPQLAEQQRLGPLLAGKGPALILGYEWYYAEHFMHDLQFTWLVPNVDLDTVHNGGLVLRYRTIVRSTGPLVSRPPSSFHRVWSSRLYEIWEKNPAGVAVYRHLGLGLDGRPTAVPNCTTVENLATVAAEHHGRVAYAESPTVVGFGLGQVDLPRGWKATDDGINAYPTSDARISVEMPIRSGGTYQTWIGGFTPGKLVISVDGRPIGTITHLIERPGQFYPLDRVSLTTGTHTISLDYTRPLLQPGSRATLSDAMGPIAFSETGHDTPVRYLAPAKASALCGRSLDWIEAVGPA